MDGLIIEDYVLIKKGLKWFKRREKDRFVILNKGPKWFLFDQLAYRLFSGCKWNSHFEFIKVVKLPVIKIMLIWIQWLIQTLI